MIWDKNERQHNYSKKSEINANIQILEEFVDEYKFQEIKNITQECFSQGITDKAF